MDWSLSRAIITGGASGLGQAVAQQIIQADGQLAILDKNPAAAQSFLNNQQADKEKVRIVIETDVCSDESVKKAVSIAKQELGHINLLVNCAGIVMGKKMLSTHNPLDMQSFQKLLNINLYGTYRLCQSVAGVMQHNPEQGKYNERGIIINTASIAAYEGQIGQIAYSASKGAIISMTLPMSRELAPFGIRVMCIAPGLFNTQLMAELPAELKQQLSEHILFPKQLGNPKAFASLVQAIVENPFLNGSVIRLDAGLRMPGKSN